MPRAKTTSIVNTYLMKETEKFVRSLMPAANNTEIAEGVTHIREYIIFLYTWFIVEKNHLKGKRDNSA